MFAVTESRPLVPPILRESPVVRVLVRARALIKRGWCHGFMTWTNPDGSRSYCLVGSLYEAADMNEKLIREAAAVISRANGIRGELHDWNDDPDQTQVGVLSGLDRAIAAARRQGGSA